MIYKMLPKLHPNDVQIFIRIDDDNISRMSCTENDPEYLKWIEEGNVALPADENA